MRSGRSFDLVNVAGRAATQELKVSFPTQEKFVISIIRVKRGEESTELSTFAGAPSEK